MPGLLHFLCMVIWNLIDLMFQGLSHVLRMGSAIHWLPFLAPVMTSVVALLTLIRNFSTVATSPVRRASCIACWAMSVYHIHGAVMATQTVLTPVMSSAVVRALRSWYTCVWVGRAGSYLRTFVIFPCVTRLRM